ncbi:MAG TPA: hypothetical protein VKE94_16205 [Gemmataceae bacterium]|nr:hypothetical protein [Gemmataceae bacterium]
MSQSFRVFGRSDVQPAPAALAKELNRLLPGTAIHFRGDDLGWFEARVTWDADEPPIRIERYLTKEDDVRGELNTWAAWLESAGESPEHLRLMQHVVGTKQTFTLHCPVEEGYEPADESLVESLCLGLCTFLARETDGIYQVDHRGFFEADGRLIVPEEPQHAE